MAKQSIKRIAAITGSTRALRIGPQVIKFITPILENDLSAPSPNKSVTFTLSQVDIVAFKLQVHDEFIMPAAVPTFCPIFPFSKAWRAEIAKYDS
jgi:hypothetical protein